MAKDLRSSGFANVIVKPLEDDLKYYNTEKVVKNVSRFSNILNFQIKISIQTDRSHFQNPKLQFFFLNYPD